MPFVQFLIVLFGHINIIYGSITSIDRSEMMQYMCLTPVEDSDNIELTGESVDVIQSGDEKYELMLNGNAKDKSAGFVREIYKLSGDIVRSKFKAAKLDANVFDGTTVLWYYDDFTSDMKHGVYGVHFGRFVFKFGTPIEGKVNQLVLNALFPSVGITSNNIKDYVEEMKQKAKKKAEDEKKSKKKAEDKKKDEGKADKQANAKGNAKGNAEGNAKVNGNNQQRRLSEDGEGTPEASSDDESKNKKESSEDEASKHDPNLIQGIYYGHFMNKFFIVHNDPDIRAKFLITKITDKQGKCKQPNNMPSDVHDDLIDECKSNSNHEISDSGCDSNDYGIGLPLCHGGYYLFKMKKEVKYMYICGKRVDDKTEDHDVKLLTIIKINTGKAYSCPSNSISIKVKFKWILERYVKKLHRQNEHVCTVIYVY